MAEKNQDVLDMIEQIRARLLDLEEDVRACEAELPGMATRLDRIDDRIYLLESEVASRSDAARHSRDRVRVSQPRRGRQPAIHGGYRGSVSEEVWR